MFSDNKIDKCPLNLIIFTYKTNHKLLNLRNYFLHVFSFFYSSIQPINNTYLKIKFMYLGNNSHIFLFKTIVKNI